MRQPDHHIAHGWTILMKLTRHPESWLNNDELGSRSPAYLPTYTFRGEFIDRFHRFYSECPRNGAIIDIGIPGWLLPADALKLYEMAYYATGDILELGSYHGLSTSILGQAVANSGRKHRVVTLELDADALRHTVRNTEATKDIHDFMLGDAVASCRELTERDRAFDFAFVDHSHTYHFVRQACEDLKSLLRPGGFALFHDFNDARNSQDPDYGVYQAVQDGFADGSFEFYGVYGCTGLYRRALKKQTLTDRIERLGILGKLLSRSSAAAQ